MILLDDNFSSIVVGVEEGRRIYDNMKKTVAYILAGNFTTLLPFLVYVILGLPQAISTITVLMIALGTDMLPAIALAYEKAEGDIMSLPPRNPKKDRLVTRQLLMRSYTMVGIIAAAAGFFGYFIPMIQSGWFPRDLFQIRDHWNDRTINDLQDSYGQHWTYAQRQSLQQEARSSYFIAIVVCQWVDVIVCKTRRGTLFVQGMTNHMVNFGIVFETCLACFFCYTPVVNGVLTVTSVNWWVWVFAMAFSCYIFCFEELRKLIVRRFPKLFLAGELYY